MLNAKRLYFMLFGIIAVTILALFGSVYGATIVLKQKSKDISKAQLKSLTLEEEQRLLKKAEADVQKYKELAQIAKSIVPTDKDQARTIREINNLAAEQGVKLGSISFPASSLGQQNVADAQLKPVTGIPGVSVLTITVKSDNKNRPLFSNFIKFLDALEHNRRTALVRGIALEPDPNDYRKLNFSLTLDEYIKL